MGPSLSFDADEVKKHVTEDDCWIIIHEKVDENDHANSANFMCRRAPSHEVELLNQ